MNKNEFKNPHAKMAMSLNFFILIEETGWEIFTLKISSCINSASAHFI